LGHKFSKKFDIFIVLQADSYQLSFSNIQLSNVIPRRPDASLKRQGDEESQLFSNHDYCPRDFSLERNVIDIAPSLGMTREEDSDLARNDMR
jgi:hypothetical protein